MVCTKRPQSAIWRLARRQHGVVSRSQLLGLGLTRSAISHRLRAGRLWRLHRGVFAVGRPDLTREGAWLAAVLACGEGAALSHRSAAALWGIRERRPPARPQVSVPTNAGRSGPRGVDLRRALTLTPEDVTLRDRIPVTTLARTLTDLAAAADAKDLKAALRQSERVHSLDLDALRTCLDGAPRHSHRHQRLIAALDAFVPGTQLTESELELAFLELCTRRRLALPEPQVPIGAYRADFLWSDRRLIVEVDGRGSHDGYIAFADDRVKDRALKAAGYEVLRFTRNEVVREPGKVAREVGVAIERRRRELG